MHDCPGERKKQAIFLQPMCVRDICMSCWNSSVRFRTGYGVGRRLREERWCRRWHGWISERGPRCKAFTVNWGYTPDYSAEQVMRVLMEAVVQAYLYLAEGSTADSNGHTLMKELCRQFQISNLKIRKLLVTAGVYQEIYQKSGQLSDLPGYIQNRKKEGAAIEELMQELSLSRSSIYSYLPYEWGIYQTKIIRQQW